MIKVFRMEIDMTLIICLDNRNGISFNNRRQSRDSVVIKRIVALSRCSKLHIAEYSKSLFQFPCSCINVCDKPIQETSENEFCFIEDEICENDIEKVSKIIIFRWDKVYPQDKSFKCDLKKWTLVHSETFIGSSHEVITEEVYTK